LGRAQNINASISGEVTDPSGASVPGATLVLTSKDTGTTASFTSDADGLYTFRNVVPGTYNLKATAKGFEQYVQDGILVRVGFNLRQDVHLQLGTLQEKVEVSANASQLNFENSEHREGISPEIIKTVPLLVSGSIRSAANFVTLLPGVTTGRGDSTGVHSNGG